MTSIPQKRLDKENSSEVLSNTNKLINTLKPKCNVYSTPINKTDTTRPDLSSTVKRKALGDLYNTAKANKKLFQNFMTPTKNPSVMSILNGYSAKKNADFSQLDKNSNHNFSNKISNKNAKSEIEEIEDRFIPPPMDTFNDLFENGKLSEMILNKKFIFMPFLPTGSIMQNEKRRLSALNSIDESEWNQQLNQWKEAITNDAQIESKDLCNDMPTIEDLAFKIPDNFDLI